MNSFAIYLRQRFNIWLFTALSLYLLLFAKASFEFELLDAFQFILVFFFLLVMRLYDDLQSAHIDEGKPNRIYTVPAAAKELTITLIVLLFLFVTVLLCIDWLLGLYGILFLGVNHLLYRLFFYRNGFHYFLALLKYPAIVWALTGQLNFYLPAIFLSFLVFEIIEDKQFPIRGSYANYIVAVVFGLLLAELRLRNAWPLVLFFAISVLVIFINSRYSPYIFLGLFLLGRLTILIQ